MHEGRGTTNRQPQRRQTGFDGRLDIVNGSAVGGLPPAVSPTAKAQGQGQADTCAALSQPRQKVAQRSGRHDALPQRARTAMREVAQLRVGVSPIRQHDIRPRTGRREPEGVGAGIAKAERRMGDRLDPLS